MERALRILLALVLALLFSASAYARPLLGSGPLATSPAGDLMAACITAQGGATNVVVDLSTCSGVGPNTTLSSIAYNCPTSPSCPPGDTAANIANVDGPFGAVGCWSAGIFDPTNEQLLIWGGGHVCYNGNQLQAFQTKTLQFVNLDRPSVIDGLNTTPITTCILPDNTPAVPHTYDTNAFVPGSATGHGFYSLQQFGCNNNANAAGNNWNVDPAALSAGSTGAGVWVQRTSAPVMGDNETFAKWDPTTSRLILINTNQTCCGQQSPASYNPVTDTWSLIGSTEQHFGTGNYQTSTMAPGSPSRLIAVGAAGVQVLNVSTGAVTNPTPSGGAGCVTSSDGPGFDWDTDNNVGVCWDGGQTIDVINSALTTVSTITMGGATILCADAIATPGCTSSTGHQSDGTFKRWSYDPGHHVFILVNAYAGKAYMYIPGGGA